MIGDLESYLVGYALHHNSYSSLNGRCMYLQNLYVTEPLRGQGIGQLLLQAVAKVTVLSVFHYLLQEGYTLAALVCLKNI